MARGSDAIALRASCCLVGAITALAGCSQDVPQSPYAARYEEALRSATSDFEKKVLADGEVTRAEYDEANALYVRCMGDSGITVKLLEQGGYTVYSRQKTPGGDEIDTRCSEGTISLVAGLYVDQLTNPSDEDIDTLTVACLVRAGLVDETYTPERFADEAHSKAFTFDSSAPAFDACMSNPSQGMPYP